MAKAIPAYPGLMSRQQPDGTVLTVQLHGDEYLNFTTTADGYTVVLRADGFYCYAQLNADGKLEPTSLVAHDAAQRSDDERIWLNGVSKCLAPAMTVEASARRQADENLRAHARAAAQAKAPLYDYGNFHGLIILAEFKDRQFSREDYPQILEDMVNQADYKGYGNVGSGIYTGSVRDYFYDNSNGLFEPQFDIVGPYTLNVSENYPQQTEMAAQVMKKVADAADKDVDFSQYDLDHDGVVDMVYVIFAGYGAHYVGDNSKLIWPHASEFFDMSSWNYVYKDGVRLGRYACSTELLGTPTYLNFFDGIGTMCHEFGHVLGLPDLYDTNYEKGGGQSVHPGNWTIMAGGGYQNYGRTPSGYTLYERYSLGFTTPVVLSKEGSYELEALAESNIGYRLNTEVKNEFFLIENRQKTSKWEQYLPGHGMVVFRVDSTNAGVWQRNEVNCNPKHNYFVLLRANGDKNEEGSASDPFPGSKKVTSLNNETSPANLLTWSGKASRMGFENIKEKNGVISFDFVDVAVLRSITLTDSISMGLGLSTTLEPVRTPDYAPYTLTWTTDNPAVCTVDATGVITARSVGQAVITVTANDNEELSAQCVVTVEELPEVADIATCREQTDDELVMLHLNDALVLLATGSKTLIRDASGALCIDAEGLDVETGDLLNGVICGKKATVNNIHTLVSVGAATNHSGFTAEKGHEVTPRRLTIDELTDADRCDLVTICAVPLERVSNNVWAVGGDERIRVFNVFQIPDIKGAPKTTLDGKFFDVTGIYYTNKVSGKVIDEIEMTASVIEVEAPSAIRDIMPADADPAMPAVVYTADGRLVVRTTVGQLATLSLRHGLYVVSTTAATWRLIR